jgi:hypothetical protein
VSKIVRGEEFEDGDPGAKDYTGDGVKIYEPFGKSKSMFELVHELRAVQKTGLVEFGLGRRWASKSLLWARSAGL